MKNLIILLFTFFSMTALGQRKDNDTISTAGLAGSGGELLGPKEILNSEFSLLTLIKPCNNFKCTKLKIGELQKKQVRYIDSVDITFLKEGMSIRIYSENNQYVSNNTYKVKFNDRNSVLSDFNISREQKKYIEPESFFNAREFRYKIIFRENIPGNRQLTNRIIFDKLYINE